MTEKKILALRKKIDNIDLAIIKKLASRQKLIIAIGRLKRASRTPIQDLAREKQQEKLYVKLSGELGLDPGYIKKIFGFIITHSRKLQKYVTPHLRQSSGNRGKK